MHTIRKNRELASSIWKEKNGQNLPAKKMRKMGHLPHRNKNWQNSSRNRQRTQNNDN